MTRKNSITMSNSNKEYDYLTKILLLGNSGVGKTNILLRYCQDDFSHAHLTTIGIDFKIKYINIDNKKIRMQIWDTAGQERFKTVTQTYYKGAMGILLIYAINDKQSYFAIENWVNQIKLYASLDVVMVLVGNKCDLDKQEKTKQTFKRQVTYEQGQHLAQKFEMDFFEVSAKNGSNISQIFLQIVQQIKNKVIDGGSKTSMSKSQSQSISIKDKDIKLTTESTKSNKHKKKKCCH